MGALLDDAPMVEDDCDKYQSLVTSVVLIVNLHRAHRGHPPVSTNNI